MPEINAALPWLWPGVAVGLVASVPASGPVGRWLGVRALVAWVGLFGLAVILASTLSPLPRGFPMPSAAAGICDASRVTIAPFSELVGGGDATLNVLLFIPLGLAIGLAPRSMRRAATVVGALATPFAIETVQLLAVPLRRGCETADVVDNLTGLVIGLLIGAVGGSLLPVVGRPAGPAR